MNCHNCGNPLGAPKRDRHAECEVFLCHACDSIETVLDAEAIGWAEINLRHPRPTKVATTPELAARRILEALERLKQNTRAASLVFREEVEADQAEVPNHLVAWARAQLSNRWIA